MSCVDNDPELALAARARRGLDTDLNVTAKQGQEVHEPLGGEARKPAPQEARNLRLIDFQYVGGASLRESPGANSLSYADRKVGLS